MVYVLQVKREAAGTEPAWEGAGTKVGLQIWRIVKFKVTTYAIFIHSKYYFDLSKSLYDTLYSGYQNLNTTERGRGTTTPTWLVRTGHLEKCRKKLKKVRCCFREVGFLPKSVK